VAELATVSGDDVAVLRPEGGNRHAEPLRGSRYELAPHPSGDEADRVPQHTGVVRTTGDLRGPPLLLRRGKGEVHALEGDIEVVGHLDPTTGDDALADVHLRDLEVDPVVGLNLNLQVVDGVLLAGHEDVREVLNIREFVGLRRPIVRAARETDTGGDRQRRPCDQKALEDCSTLNRSVKS